MPKYVKALMLVFGVMASLLFNQTISAADWDISRSHRAAIKELLQEMGTYDIISKSVERGLIKVAKDDAKKAARMKAMKRSVLPHLVNLEASGMDREEVRSRLAGARRLAVPPLGE